MMIIIAVAVLRVMAILLLRCLCQIGRIGRRRVRTSNEFLAMGFGEVRVRHTRSRLEKRGRWIVDGRHRESA